MYGIEIVMVFDTATNIYKIVKGYIRNNERPDYLCSSNLSVVLDDTT